jgi:hypothetical protein
VDTVPPYAKLVISALFSDTRSEPLLLRILEHEVGAMDLVGERMPFTHSNYYSEEMGSSLHRRIVSFRGLVPPDALLQAKLNAQVLEDRLRSNGLRTVNLDPALLGLHNFVLATHKGYAHRIYLGHGVYGDLTLIYRKGSFTALEWTYPDYASTEMIDLLNLIRSVYLWQRRRRVEGEANAQ